MAGRKNHEGFSIFRPQYATHRLDKDGNRVKEQSPRWHVRFKDHTETWRRLPAHTDRSASLAYARKLCALAGMRAAGEPLSAELARFIDGLAEKPRERLIEWGVIDSRAALAMRPLDEHIEAWKASIIGNRKTARHARQQEAQVKCIVIGCEFSRFADINRGDVERWLAESNKFGAATRNHYARSIKSFCRWMADTGRASHSPLVGLKMLNVEGDRKYRRRAFTVDELRWLIATAEKAGDPYLETIGEERATIYMLAASTGLRASEIRSLTPASFDLDSKRPTVTVEAKASKRRKCDVLPIGVDFAARLRLHLKRKLPAAPAFNLPEKAAKMLRRDLATARAAWIKAARAPKAKVKRLRSTFLERTDERGRVADFHSLRLTFITNLARSGVHPKQAQVLARHSTIDLTMNVYTEVGEDEQRQAIEALPTLKLAKGA